MSSLEKEDDGDLYGIISLQLLENELLEIQLLLDRLNSTTLVHQRLSDDTANQVNSCTSIYIFVCNGLPPQLFKYKQILKCAFSDALQK